MTWAEYLIRVDGYLRQMERQMLRDRRTWFNTLIAPAADPAKLPKSEEAYLPLSSDKRKNKRIADKWQDKLKQRQAEYLKAKEQKDGRT